MVEGRRDLKGSGTWKEIRKTSGICRDLVKYFKTSKELMPLEGKRRWLEVGEISRVILKGGS